jgi:hypothetical protein
MPRQSDVRHGAAGGLRADFGKADMPDIADHIGDGADRLFDQHGRVEPRWRLAEWWRQGGANTTSEPTAASGRSFADGPNQGGCRKLDRFTVVPRDAIPNNHTAAEMLKLPSDHSGPYRVGCGAAIRS